MTHGDRPRPGLVPWIGLAAALVALAAVTTLWIGARRDAAALADWQAATLRRIGRAETPPGPPPSPADAADALARIAAARDGALAMAAATAPPATPASSAAAPTPPDSGTEIGRLRATQSTGTAAGDAQIIERDSRAAWTGWQ